MVVAIKVGVYTRLSNEDRFKKNKNDDSNSIINQKSMCMKYAVNQGWEIIDIYTDDDFSGAGTYRPEFERMLKDCESGRINLVLCKSQSRFSRDMEVIEKYLHNKFILWGVRFVSIVDNADTDEEYNKKSRQINGLMNEWYLDDLSTNIKKSLKNKREDGLFMGSFACYGYKRSEEDKHKLVIDPVPAEVVKKIFELYRNGLGYYKIAEYLNKNKILTPSQYKKQCGSKFNCNVDPDNTYWSVDTIAKLLRNETYIGTLVQGKKTSISYKIHKSKRLPKDKWCRIENAHEPIIDIETWNAVQARLNSHTKINRSGEIHFLSKKVYCKECGKIFTRTTHHVKSEPTGLRVYLQCKGAKRFNTCDNKRSVVSAELEKILLDEINKLIELYYDKEMLEEKYKTEQLKRDNTKAKIQTLKQESDMLDKKINENKEYYCSLYEDKVKGYIDGDMFLTLSKKFTNEINQMEIRKEKINEEINLINNQNKNKISISKVLEKYKHIDNLNKVIIDEFIDKVYIGNYDKETKSRTIEIKWNFEF